MSQIVELETERMFSKRKIFTTPLCMLRLETHLFIMCNSNSHKNVLLLAMRVL